ncbi:MAG: peptidoglycan-binding protein [Clostridiales bacterium]|nr:peptidoglycan-binding protein [Clostridiales bacterium]
MKKAVALILITMMCFSAFAADIPFAETQLDKAVLTERYGAAVEDNGDFNVSSIKAKAIENLFYGKIATYAAGGMLMFNVQVEGNFETGICYPVLRVLYAGSAALNANTVMFNVDGTVYSARVSSEVTNHGRYRIETMKAYLTEDGFALVNALKKASKAEITVLGNDQYTQTAEKTAFYASQKLEISAECLSAMEMPLGTPDFASYELKALCEKAFDAKYGAGTKVEKTESVKCAYTLDESFGLAADNAPAATIKAVQDLLKKNGFFVGNTGMQMTAEMIAAVKAAQGYYGFDVTGFADARLINALSGNAQMAEIKAEDHANSYAHSFNQASFNVKRWWLADRVETTVPGGGVSVSDKDNVLLIFDGEIASHALKSLSLSWEIKAEVVKDGKYAFPCAIYTETQEGSVFSTTLGMLREGRLVIVCEIPETVSDIEGEWTLNVSAGGEEFALNLSK